MVDNILDRICANLASLPFFAEVYGVAELVKDKYAIIKAGEGKPVFYQDARNGLVYLRKNGRVQIETSEEKSDLACDDYQTRRHPYRVVAVAKRESLNNAALSSLAANISAALDIELKKAERAPLGLSEAYVEITGYLEDREELISSEKLPEKLSLDLAVVAVDIEIVLGGQQACFDANTCFVPPAPPVVQSRVPQVQFSPQSSIYAGFVSVVMTNELGGVSIYYTTNGTFPTPQSGILYTGAVLITSDTSFNAVGYLNGYLPSFVSQISYLIVLNTVFSIPQGGQYLIGTLQPIVLGSNSLSALIYYTTNGSEPTQASTLFSGSISPFQVITTLRFRAFDAPAAPSAIGIETYNIQALPAIVTPSAGTFINSQSVTFTNPNAFGQVWASLNGGSFQVVGTETFTQITSYIAEVRAAEYVTSAQVSGTISIQCAAVTFSPNGGEFDNTTVEITLSTITLGAAIHYTTDGSEPTILSTLYNPLSKPILTQSATIRAKAFKVNLIASATTQATFVVSAKFYLVGNAGAGTQRLYQSVNNGATWIEIQPFGNASRLYLDSQISDNGASTLIVEGASAQNIRISKDTLQTWQTPTFPSALVSSVLFKGTSDGGVFIACANIGNARNQILVSIDGGLSFVDRSPSLATFSGCEISPDGTTMYAFKSSISNINNDVIYRSTDLGLNWTAVYTLANRRVTSAACSDDAVYTNVVNQNDNAVGIFRLLHTSTLLTDLTTAIGALGGAAATQRAISVSNNDDVLIAWNTANTTTRRSTNQGGAFATVALTFSGAIRLSINGIGTKVIVGGTSSNLNISIDSGQTYASPATTPGSGNRSWQLADVN